MHKSLYQIVEGRRGKFLVNPNDTFIGSSLIAYGEWGEAEVRLFDQLLKPGDVVVEVGANIGSHTIPLSKVVGQTGVVHAFEPQRLVHQMLNANLALNDCFNVFPYRTAVGATEGHVDICNIPPYHPLNYGNIVIGMDYGGDSAMERVPLITIDRLDVTRLDLLKVDAEGMDLQVLQGAIVSIQKHRPAIFTEATPASASAITTFFEKLGYTAYWYGTTLFDRENFFGNPLNIWSKPDLDVLVSADVLALPNEGQWAVEGLMRFEEVTNWNFLPIDQQNYRARLKIHRRHP